MSEKRSFFLMMLNTTPKETAASYATVGDGVTELTVNYNPQTSTEQFIHQDSATTELTGYQPNAPVTAQVVKTDPAFQFVNGLRKKRAIGSDAHTDVGGGYSLLPVLSVRCPRSACPSDLQYTGQQVEQQCRRIVFPAVFHVAGCGVAFYCIKF